MLKQFIYAIYIATRYLKEKKHRVRENKKRYGTSISSRPEMASLRLEEGHWEGDTVVGKRAGKEAVVFSFG